MRNTHNKKTRKARKARKTQSTRNKVNIRYLPYSLTKKDREKQIGMLKKSQKMYKKRGYYTRQKLSSYKSKKSKHILKAEKIYGLETIQPDKELAEKTKCSVDALEKIVSKGEGAYFSSGSRPNQTGQSWGIARLASAITGGKASLIDYSILKTGCRSNSKALRMANKNKRMWMKQMRRRMPKVSI
jgi:hypothetical protein